MNDTYKVALEIVRNWADVTDVRSLTLKDMELVTAITRALQSKQNELTRIIGKYGAELIARKAAQAELVKIRKLSDT